MKLFQSKKEEYELVPLRACHCGEMNYRSCDGIPGYICNNCGALYSLTCINPVAELRLITNGKQKTNK